MPLTLQEYGCMDSFSVLYSGGLDSCAVPLIIGPHTQGGIHLLTYKHKYGTFFNNWSESILPISSECWACVSSTTSST